MGFPLGDANENFISENGEMQVSVAAHGYLDKKKKLGYQTDTQLTLRTPKDNKFASQIILIFLTKTDLIKLRELLSNRIDYMENYKMCSFTWKGRNGWHDHICYREAGHPLNHICIECDRVRTIRDE